MLCSVIVGIIKRTVRRFFIHTFRMNIFLHQTLKTQFSPAVQACLNDQQRSVLCRLLCPSSHMVMSVRSLAYFFCICLFYTLQFPASGDPRRLNHATTKGKAFSGLTLGIFIELATLLVNISIFQNKSIKQSIIIKNQTAFLKIMNYGNPSFLVGYMLRYPALQQTSLSRHNGNSKNYARKEKIGLVTTLMTCPL